METARNIRDIILLIVALTGFSAVAWFLFGWIGTAVWLIGFWGCIFIGIKIEDAKYEAELTRSQLRRENEKLSIERAAELRAAECRWHRAAVSRYSDECQRQRVAKSRGYRFVRY